MLDIKKCHLGSSLRIVIVKWSYTAIPNSSKKAKPSHGGPWAFKWTQMDA